MTNKGIIGQLLLVLLCLLAMPVGGAWAGSLPVPAPMATQRPSLIVPVQEVDDRPLLMRLFGLKRQPKPGPKIITVPTNQPPKKRKVVPAVVISPKNPDARSVLVIGDANADALAKTLDIVFADTPTIKLENKAVGGSGMVATEKIDWIKTLETRLNDPAPIDAIVVMMGLSDVAPQMVDGAAADFRSQSWSTVYGARIRALIGLAQERGKPLIWVGLVPAADPELSDNFAFLNEFYRSETARAGADFVDLWPLFADEAGGFAFEGPDIAGQVRQLRLKDGVGFTKSGKRKLAFYVEQEIRGLWSGTQVGPAVPVQKVEDGLILSLNDPEAGPDEDLVGPADSSEPKPGTALYDLVVLGKPLLPRVGRVDDLMSQ